jgi:uncharacterized NAD-dependent epimerase/dehydratase family protein
MPRDPRFLILAEGAFNPLRSKTGNACIRYSPERVAAVLDSTQAGKTVQQVLGFGGRIPVVGSFDEGLAGKPNALLIGISPQGGKLPGEWRAVIVRALDDGLDVWSGLHVWLGADAEFAVHAASSGATIHDLRKPPPDLDIARGLVRAVESTIILTVGTDCNVGKMTAALQMRDGLRARGRRVAFAATGQTGILVDGKGISVDAVIADFIAGAAERLVIEAAKSADIVIVEGQGSIIHPAYSGVTYGLLHGAMPHALVMCTQPSRTAIRFFDWMPIPPLAGFIRMQERAALRPAPVIGVAVNTYDLDEGEARAAIERARLETGLPTVDPVRLDPGPLIDAIEAFHDSRAR